MPGRTCCSPTWSPAVLVPHPWRDTVRDPSRARSVAAVVRATGRRAHRCPATRGAAGPSWLTLSHRAGTARHAGRRRARVRVTHHRALLPRHDDGRRGPHRSGSDATPPGGNGSNSSATASVATVSPETTPAHTTPERLRCTPRSTAVDVVPHGVLHRCTTRLEQRGPTAVAGLAADRSQHRPRSSVDTQRTRPGRGVRSRHP